jgi:hypothetical protein
METRNEKLKSELLYLQGDYNDPNTHILPIPEKMGEEEFLKILRDEERVVQENLFHLEKEFDY